MAKELESNIDLDSLYKKINKSVGVKLAYRYKKIGNNVVVISENTKRIGVFKTIIDYIYIRTTFVDDVNSKYVHLKIFMVLCAKTGENSYINYASVSWNKNKAEWEDFKINGYSQRKM